MHQLKAADTFQSIAPCKSEKYKGITLASNEQVKGKNLPENGENGLNNVELSEFVNNYYHEQN